jgi:hypothetical protein
MGFKDLAAHQTSNRNEVGLIPFFCGGTFLEKPSRIKFKSLEWCPGAAVVISNISMACFPNPTQNVPLFSIAF